MWQIIFLLIALTSIGRLSSSVSVGQYKSWWIPDTKWTFLSDRPSNPKTYGRSIELCSMACTEDYSENANEACEAFSITDEGECQFGSIEADTCLGVLDQSAPTYIKVFVNVQKYETFKVHELHTINFDAEESYTNILEQDTGCSPVLSVPKDETVTYDAEKPAQLINHGKGVLSCGGVNSAGTNLKACKYWQPGMSAWEDRPEMKANHDVGSCATSLGQNEAFIVGHSDGLSAAEVLSGGAWNRVADFPVSVKFCYAFALSSRVIYVMGGGPSGNDKDITYSYKYDRWSNTWIKMPDLVYATQVPSCTRAAYKGKDTLLCVSGFHLGNNGKTQYFDLGQETWHNEGMVFASLDPKPSTGFTRTSYTMENLFYRIKGRNLWIWNLETNVWSEGEMGERGQLNWRHELILATEVIKKIP